MRQVPTITSEIEEGLLIVEKQLQGRTVRTGEEELFKARLDTRSELL